MESDSTEHSSTFQIFSDVEQVYKQSSLSSDSIIMCMRYVCLVHHIHSTSFLEGVRMTWLFVNLSLRCDWSTFQVLSMYDDPSVHMDFKCTGNVFHSNAERNIFNECVRTFSSKNLIISVSSGNADMLRICNYDTNWSHNSKFRSWSTYEMSYFSHLG